MSDRKHNTWNVTNETKDALRDIKRIVEKRLGIKTRLTHNLFMVLIANNYKKIIDVITKSELAIKEEYQEEEYGIVYRCKKCNEPTFVRKFGTNYFKCILCGSTKEHKNDKVGEDYFDEKTKAPKTRIDIIEEIGKDLEKRFKRKKKLDTW